MVLIDYKNVNVRQAEGELVLEKVNLQVEEGEFVYLTGKVGSGKSSLLKTIYQELDIDEADQATVLGKNLLEIKRRDVPALRKQMGIIFQDFQLLSDRSVYNNLRFVLKATGWKDKGQIVGRIDKVLKEVGLLDKADRMPHELSGGEQQRVAIARAVLNEPKMIIADEPTGNLDQATADSIIELLRKIAQGGTAVIMSTHNTALLDKYPGTVYHCAEGIFKKM